MEVPNATTVSPMAKFEIPIFFAIEEDPLTRKSAPKISIAKPAISHTNWTIIKL
jgi:hypothetical protein